MDVLDMLVFRLRCAEATYRSDTSPPPRYHHPTHDDDHGGGGGGDHGGGGGGGGDDDDHNRICYIFRKLSGLIYHI